jgi:uncharacterized protein (TIGR03000 family)
VTIEIAAGSKLTVDGKEVTFAGNSQTFVTPALDPSRIYFYEMKATGQKDGKPVAATKRVSVQAGHTIKVDLKDMKSWTAPKPEKEEAALINVKLPDDARLYVDGVLCPLSSGERTFDTPALERGKTFHYTLKAEITRSGKTVSETQVVEVEAGKQVAVEFNKLPVVAASR